MTARKILGALLVLTLALPAAAIEASSTVRVTPLLRTAQSWDGKPIAYPAGAGEAVMLIVEIAPGGQTGWHEHGVPSFAYVLQGELEVRLADGRKNRLVAGDALAEVVGVLHNGRVVGDVPVRLVVFYTAGEGRPLTVAHPEFQAPEK